jgi:hypothetical protein
MVGSHRRDIRKPVARDGATQPNVIKRALLIWVIAWLSPKRVETFNLADQFKSPPLPAPARISPPAAAEQKQH